MTAIDVKHPISLNGLFITGSDTGIGKTWVSCQLIPQLASRYPSIKVRKPVESGCQRDALGALIAADGSALFNANNKAETLDQVTPYRFAAALAPDRAAKLEGHTLRLEQLYRAVIKDIEENDFVVVEGAGGFYSPIAEDGLNADLAARLGLRVLIVVADRLGAINQALLCIDAVEKQGLTIQCVVLNQLEEEIFEQLDNLSDLQARTHYPVYRCAYQSPLPSILID